MKKLQIFALVAIMAIGLGSCTTGSDGPEKGTARLTIQLSGVKAATRAIETGAVTGQLAITGAQSLIFVADAGGTIIHRENIDPAEAIVAGPGYTDGEGQELEGEFALGSLVYIVANIPDNDYDEVEALTTIDAVKAAFSAISTQEGYTTPAMANEDGEEATVIAANVVGEAATIRISISPLIARLELAGIQALDEARDGSGGGTNDFGNVITGFDVTGVYIGDYFPNFDYTAAVPDSDVLVSLSDAVDAASDAAALAGVFTGWESYMKNETSVSADAQLLAQPDGGEVWAYNLVASGTPHIVIRIDNITYDNSAGVASTLTGPRYLTVTGYTNVATAAEDDAFERGQVHRVGKVTAGDSNFKFGYGDLSSVPYEDAYKLTVQVEVVDWSITDYTPILE